MQPSSERLGFVRNPLLRHSAERDHRAGGDAELAHQDGRVVIGKVGHLGEIRPARNEHEPGEARIVQEQHRAKRKLADREGVGFKARIEGEGRRIGRGGKHRRSFRRVPEAGHPGPAARLRPDRAGRDPANSTRRAS